MKIIIIIVTIIIIADIWRPCYVPTTIEHIVEVNSFKLYYNFLAWKLLFLLYEIKENEAQVVTASKY